MYLLYDNSLLFGLGFPLAATLSASIIANIEHQANGWKQTLSFPVSRMRIYVSKFICLVVSLFICQQSSCSAWYCWQTGRIRR